jgi:hypothetical protein
LEAGQLQGVNAGFFLYDDDNKEILAISVWEDSEAFEAAGLVMQIAHEDAARLGMIHIETRTYSVLGGMGLEF